MDSNELYEVALWGCSVGVGRCLRRLRWSLVDGVFVVICFVLPLMEQINVTENEVKYMNK